jgi:probable HAF family extracellular repeat protein
MRRSLTGLAWLAAACGGAGEPPSGDPTPSYGIRLLDPTPAIQKRAAEQTGGASTQVQIQAASADGAALAGTSTAVANDSGDPLLSEPFRFSAATGTIGLGTVPNQTFNEARLISADGSTIVGQSDPNHAFRWTQDSGVRDLGAIPDSIGTIALDVSEDGSVVVGASQVQSGVSQKPRALRWTSGNLTTLIADTTTANVAMLVRGGGSAIFGTAAASVFRWTEPGGVQLFDSLPGDQSDIYQLGDASTDGSIFAGTRSKDGGAGQVFRYTPAAGMIGLEPIATYNLCGAVKVSGNGDVVVGYCDRITGDVLESEQAFRWTETTGMVGLGFLPGAPHSFPTCMSADGSLIVGNSGRDADTAASFIWDGANGMRPLRSLFEDDPVTKDGWIIDRGACVSADGKVVFGEMQPRGTEVRAWVARLPAQSQLANPDPP